MAKGETALRNLLDVNELLFVVRFTKSYAMIPATNSQILKGTIKKEVFGETCKTMRQAATDARNIRYFVGLYLENKTIRIGRSK